MMPVMCSSTLKTIICIISVLFDQRGASYSVTDFSMLSNPAGTQNVSCLGLCDWDICPKNYAQYGLGTFNPQ